ncbi:DUF3160 domain-containing protein [Patescibacteria group bacterium]|nr:DUF3160 domain-containing protein [Patescibacteria group bacterium]
MSSEMPTILSAEGQVDTSSQQSFDDSGGNFSSKKIIVILIALITIIALVLIFVFRFYSNKNEGTKIYQENEEENEPELPKAVLPILEHPSLDEVDNLATSTDLLIEYLTFATFYNKKEMDLRPAFEQYNLPINTKIDIINYHDTARKLNLDPVIEDINNYGFALIDNPWQGEINDFYSAYAKLREEQIPLFISSDFLIYYHQNVMKKTFKDIEENIFYYNIWDINKDLYDRAKTRYEARLSEVGNINDPLLEASRLATVFFAVSLELLKPQANQIAPIGVQINEDKFSVAEANRFAFNVPINLKDDVEAELLLIREAKKTLKSPVLLYDRDYSDFIVPSDYRRHAKLHNFYLASKWLNSVFPLYYQEDNCASCLLDREDWRINFIAALLISEDFNSLPQIKNRWARIYKVISFFKGLKDNLDYINYRDAALVVFGENYDIEAMFKGDNESIDENLNSLSKEISKYEFLEIQGGPSVNDLKEKINIGFKVLSDSYSPDNYLLSRLVSPTVSDYLAGATVADNNVTACGQRNNLKRCNGFSYDIINLVYPLQQNKYFIENSNYNYYDVESARLSKEVKLSVDNHASNYWSSLAFIKEFLEFDQELMPSFAKSSEWENKSLQTAAAAWANNYVPLEKFSLNQSLGVRGLDDFARWSESSYIEPNLALVNELISINEMVLETLLALKIETEIRQVVEELRSALVNLEQIKAIVTKEISGEKIDSTDFEFISDFAAALEIVEPIKDKSFIIKPETFTKNLIIDLNDFKFVVIVNQREGQKFFSVGPVWNYSESAK